MKTRQLALYLSLSFILVGLYGCEPFTPQEQDALDRAPKHVVVLTTDHPLSYQKDVQGQVWGIDAELLEMWAARYNIDIEYKTYRTQEEVLAAYHKGDGDIAAARLPTLNHGEDVLSGPALEETHLSLYCLKKQKIENVKDLSNKTISVREKDLTTELKSLLQKSNHNTKINIFTNATTRDLIMTLAKKEADCAVVENLEGAYSAQTYLMVEKVTALTEEQPMSWWVRPNRSELVTLMQIWHQQASRKNQVMQVMDRYQMRTPDLDGNDIRYFYRSLRSTFPRYKKLFKEAAEEYQIPWQILAAVAYQESHWDPNAKSYTGVKGLMQITQETADHLGMNDRENATESVWGGAKYLRYLYLMTPTSLDKKERWALTLAAYNIGIAHIKDVQKLAEQKGLNPLAWRDLKKLLPLLSEPSTYENLEYGFARGNETVEYVSRTFAFYKLLALRD